MHLKTQHGQRFHLLLLESRRRWEHMNRTPHKLASMNMQVVGPDKKLRKLNNITLKLIRR